jgi:tetratricopeptide (TPR) repeat protein
MGLNYYHFKDYDQAIAIARHAQFNDTEMYYERFNTDLIGMCYLRKGSYDSARVWLEKTLAISKKQGKEDPLWQGIALGNIGKTWYFQQQYGKAAAYLQEVIQLTFTPLSSS